MFTRIRYKLLFTYLLLVAFGTGTLAAYVLFAFHDFYLTRVREDLYERAAAVSDEVAAALQEHDRQRLQYLARSFARQTRHTFRVFDSRMKLLVSSRLPPPDAPPWIDLPGMRAASRGVVASGIMFDPQPRSEKLYVVVPVKRGGKRLGYLRISLLLGEFRRMFARVQAAVALGLSATMVGCAVISLLLARSLTDPVRQMSDFAEAVGAGRFGGRLTPQSSDEIGRLSAALNRMCEKLERQEEDRRAFLAAVSHELRTPAGNIQVTLESLLGGAAEQPVLRDRFLKAALKESERLSQLVRDLMDLARLEAGGVPLAAEPVSLAEVIERAREILEPRLREASLLLEAQVQSGVWVTGDAERLLQVLLNLLDNAIKFAPCESAIRLSLHASRHEAELVVEDEGPGIPPEDLPFLFERFYTVDRSRARGQAGAGLGLAIVRQIVEAHHGEVEAASLPGKGARFIVRLPCAPSPSGARH